MPSPAAAGFAAQLPPRARCQGLSTSDDWHRFLHRNKIIFKIPNLGWRNGSAVESAHRS